MICGAWLISTYTDRARLSQLDIWMLWMIDFDTELIKSKLLSLLFRAAFPNHKWVPILIRLGKSDLKQSSSTVLPNKLLFFNIEALLFHP